MSPLSRREWIQAGAAAAGVVAFSESDRAQAAELASQQGSLPPNVQWSKAPCRFCGTGCGVEVAISDKKIVAVRGDLANPVNKGLLCVKGYHTPGLLYGKDRLTRPLLRKPDGSLSPISWDEAIALIADKYAEALKAGGPESVAMYGSGQWTVFDGYAALKFMKAGLKSNNLEANARLCMASAVAGFMTQFQSDEPMGCYEDFEAGDDFIMWGNNMAEMHPVLFSRILERKRLSPGTRIIDIATRRTPTSDYADLYLEIQPNSDLALANAVLHCLVRDNKVHETFVRDNACFRRGIDELEKVGYGCFDGQADRYTFSDSPKESNFEEFKTFLKDYSPEKAAVICGVSASQIETLAQLYGDNRRNAVSLWCMGVNQHTRGSWMNNLITNIHLLTGKISKPGNNPFSLTGQPSACGTVREVGTLCDRLPADRSVTKPAHRAEVEKAWGVPAGTIPEKPGYHTVDLFRAFMRGDIRCLWIQTTNPWVSMPHLSRMDRKPGDGRFLIVSEIYPTPTTDRADLILPSAAWVEREGIFGNTERRTQHWDKAVDPPGEAREDAWQIMEVARKMGFGHLFPWPANQWHKLMYEEYRQLTLGGGKDLASYDELRATRGMLWPVVNGKETRYRYNSEYDSYAKKKGVHFYKAKDYGEKAAIWLRPWHPAPESPDKEYPFWLSTGRVLEHWHTGSMTRRIKQLHQAVPGAYVEINRSDAAERGFKTGDRVRLVSRRGQVELSVVVDGRGKPPRGSLFVPFFDEARLVNLLTLDAMDCLSKEPDYKKCAVRIDRV